MADLGEFGAALEELDPTKERDTFKFFGKEFEVVGAMPPMLHFQIAAAMSGKVDDDEGAVAMWEALSVSLDEPDLPAWEGSGVDNRVKPLKQFRGFYRLAVEKHASLESLMTLAMTLFEAGSGHPTGEVHDSPVGLSPTSPSSSTSSSTPLVFGQEPHDMTTPTRLVPASRVLTG